MKTNKPANACPKCGAPVPAEAPEGLCPRCVLAAAATPEPAPTATSQIPSLERLAVAFPQLQIIELIGRGGMGFVFKARQPHLDRFVALKLLPDSLAHDPQFAERFNREGRVLARLNHPNIVSIFDFGQAGGFYYLMMEYVDGVNLRQAMQAGRFSPAEALAIVPKICEALQFAHEEGILHRDIKPENILLDAKGRVKIADFGIAKLVGEEHPDVSLTATGAALGTMHYMAPEQIEKPSTVDHRADIYSLGVVFYELLTGELPLGRFGPPSARTPVDPRVDDVVMRTLEREREKRFQSAGEMQTSVEHLTESGAGSLKGAPPKATSGGGQGAGGTKVNPGTIMPLMPAWSWKSILGAALVGISLIGPIFLLVVVYFAHAMMGAWEMVLALASVSLPSLAGTILGWVGLSEVSRGEKRGAVFAVFAALAWPMLLLTILTVWLVVAPVRNFSGTAPFASFVLLLVPAGIVTFMIWAVYTTTRKANGQPATERRGVLKWIFLGLMTFGTVYIALTTVQQVQRNRAMAPTAQTFALQFRLVADTADTNSPADVLLELQHKRPPRQLRVLREMLMDGSAVARAGISLETNDYSTIGIKLTAEGARRFESITASNINRQLAIVAGGRVLSAPIILTAIPGGELQISGNMTGFEIHKLIAALNRTSAERVFTPPVERSLPRSLDSPPGAICLDLDSGLFATNLSFRADQRDTREWLRTSGTELLAVGTVDQIPVVQAFDLVSIEAPTNAWETMLPQDVVWNWSLMRDSLKPESHLAAAPGHPDTYLFRTREDGFGLLQILSTSNQEPVVRIRYKLVQAAPDKKL